MGRKPINTKYGETYILKIRDKNNSVEFEMFSTPFIKKYIDENKENIPKGIEFEITKTEWGIEIDGKTSFVMF